MKTRKLTFESDQDRSYFPMLYAGFMNGGNSPSPKGMEVTRREVRILDKLDDISHDVPETGERVLNEGPQQILLDQPEYELLKRYFENTPWTTKVARQVVNISDWLANIQPEDNGA